MVHASPPGRSSIRRAAFYSHDTQGLGHVRRNIAVAGALVRTRPDVDALVLTGNPEATGLPLPPRTDVVTLPTVAKDASGHYASRTLASPLAHVTAMRSRILEGALDAYAPDLLVVDKVADGLHGELLPALRRLRERGRTRTVLGLRDILDSRATVEREWRDGATAEIIGELYDEVWVYGDRRVADLARVHPAIRPIAHLIRYTGYLAADRTVGLRQRLPAHPVVRPPAEPYALCLVGGGQDGWHLAETFVATELPAGSVGVVVTGPYLPSRQRERLRTMVAGRKDRLLLEYIPNTEEFIEQAAAVVSMAGYNTACELLCTGRPVLLVPRLRPRVEQLIRARRLAEFGVAQVLLPDELSPDTLARWLSAPPRPSARPGSIDTAGLHRVPAMAAALLAEADRVA